MNDETKYNIKLMLAYWRYFLFPFATVAQSSKISCNNRGLLSVLLH